MISWPYELSIAHNQSPFAPLVKAYIAFRVVIGKLGTDITDRICQYQSRFTRLRNLHVLLPHFLSPISKITRYRLKCLFDGTFTDRLSSRLDNQYRIISINIEKSIKILCDYLFICPRDLNNYWMCLHFSLLIDGISSINSELQHYSLHHPEGLESSCLPDEKPLQYKI